MTRKQIIEDIRASDHNKVKVAITDIDGVLRGKYMHRDKFLASLDGGFGFCDVVFGWDCNDACYDNGKYTGWHTGYPDAKAYFDEATYRTIPWENNLPFVLADFRDAAGHPLPVCPRQVLKHMVTRAESMGLTAMMGFEFEWFNFLESSNTLSQKHFLNPQLLTPGMFGYSILRAGQHREYFSALMDELEAFGVPLEGLHTETGPGVYEAAIACSDPLTAADRGVLLKAGTKEIAHRFGIVPSFMAKWNATLPGCSGHIHQSIVNKNGEPVFYDPSAEHRMSETFKHYLAGQLHCLPQILPLFAPTVNSYKRLTEGAWAPTKVNWGVDNRTVALRAIVGGAKSTRLETRVGGSDINPYLAAAAALGSGLYGIENKLSLPSGPVAGNGYESDAPRLPTNLSEAAEALGGSDIARDLFGNGFVDHYVNSRRWEWRQYQKAVTSWELERYFEVI